MQVELHLEDCQNLGQNPDRWQQWITQWLQVLDPRDPDDGLPLHLDRAYELSLRLTDDPGIQQLNGQFRGKDQPTDVLSFAALEVEAPPPRAPPWG